MNKEGILKSFDKEELKEATRVYDKMNISRKKGINLFTNTFVTPKIWRFFIDNFNMKDFKVEANGVFMESERRVMSFNNVYEEEYPIIVLKIENKSKFSKISHRDYLGSIMSLGIQRDKIGDIRVGDNMAYVPVIEEIVTFVVNNLTQIAKSPVRVTIINSKGDIPPLEFEDVIITVPSLRIDTVVSKISKNSRGDALELIESGKVLIDYTKVKNKGQDVKIGTTITVRGIGKFIVDEIVGATKSGKQKVKIKKYT